MHFGIWVKLGLHLYLDGKRSNSSRASEDQNPGRTDRVGMIKVTGSLGIEGSKFTFSFF